MKKSISFAAAALVLCASFSCRKKLSSANTELIGTWSNKYTTVIQIKADGKGYSHYDDGSSYKKIDGKVSVDGEKITFKAMGAKEVYEIDKRPYSSKGETRMDLNGETFYLK